MTTKTEIFLFMKKVIHNSVSKIFLNTEVNVEKSGDKLIVQVSPIETSKIDEIAESERTTLSELNHALKNHFKQEVMTVFNQIELRSEDLGFSFVPQKQHFGINREGAICFNFEVAAFDILIDRQWIVITDKYDRDLIALECKGKNPELFKEFEDAVRAARKRAS